MKTKEAGTAGPIRNAFFLDDNGLPLEAAWPEDINREAEVLTG